MEFLRENKKIIVVIIAASFILWTVSMMLMPIMFG